MTDLVAGQSVYISTVTYAYCGRVAEVTLNIVVLEDAYTIYMVGHGRNALGKVLAGVASPVDYDKLPVAVFIKQQAIVATYPASKVRFDLPSERRGK